MSLEDGEGDEEVEVGAEVVGPENLPKLEGLVEGELALEAAEEPAEAHEEVEGAALLCVKIKKSEEGQLGSSSRRQELDSPRCLYNCTSIVLSNPCSNVNCPFIPL